MLSSNLLVVGVTLKKKKIVKFEENLDTNIFTFLCIKKINRYTRQSRTTCNYGIPQQWYMNQNALHAFP